MTVLPARPCGLYFMACCHAYSDVQLARISPVVELLLPLLLLLLSTQSMLRSLTLGSTAIAAAAAHSNIPREACFFASIAPDGKVGLTVL